MHETGKDVCARRTGPILVGIATAAALFAMVPAGEAATINVTTTVDEYGGGGDCSLREAIQAANSNAAFGGCPKGDDASTDVIKLPAGLYTLTRGSAGEDANAEGDLDVTESVKIIGTGANLRWKPDFKWSGWDKNDWFPFESHISRKLLKSIGLGGLDKATRDLNDHDALYAGYVTGDATVVANGIGGSGTLGDGDRLFDVNDDSVDLSLFNVALIDGDIGCTGSDCKSGAGAIEHSGDGALKLKRVVVAGNSSSCSGAGCGDAATSGGNNNVGSPAAIAAIGGGDLTMKLSLVLNNRSECFDAGCDTGPGALAFGLLSGDFLDPSAGAVDFRNTAFVANGTHCDTAPSNCFGASIIELETTQDFNAHNLWMVANKSSCSGEKCGNDEIVDAHFSGDRKVTFTGVVFADNENACTGLDCDTDEIIELNSASADSSVDLKNTVFLRNKVVCNGVDCDTDEILEADRSLNNFNLSALLFVRNTLQCFGDDCDVDPVYDMDGNSVNGDAIVFHRNKIFCDGGCYDLNIWGLDSLNTTLESFVMSDNRLLVEDQERGYEIIDVTGTGPYLLKDGLIANNRANCNLCLLDTPPNTIMRVGENVTTARRLSFMDNATDGVGAAVAAGVDADEALVTSDLRVFNSKVTGNTAGGEGGGIFNAGNSTLKVRNSEITGNTAGTTGGGIHNDGTITQLTGTTISGNTPDDCFDCPAP